MSLQNFINVISYETGVESEIIIYDMVQLETAYDNIMRRPKK